MKNLARLAVGVSALLIVHSARAGASAPMDIPFVGCPSDGQMGAEPAPKGPAQSVRIEARFAARLAFYKSAYGSGLVAPRGWHCAGLEGSNGWILFVTPAAIDPSEVLKSGKRISGPALQLTSRSGETSGRFDVARLVARYFPQQRKFLQRVIAEGIEPASAFPSGPYPNDRLIFGDRKIVGYETPPHRKGLGTASWLAPGDDPIRSVVVVDDPRIGSLQLNLRLPAGMQDLLPVLIQYEQRSEPQRQSVEE